jgi:DNA-directed RNA polymerase specialized sigma24 family protein
MYHAHVEDTDDALERELREAQADFARLTAARLRRQAAVTQAKYAGWSKYRIAAVLGVERPTVDSILKAAARGED